MWWVVAVCALAAEGAARGLLVKWGTQEGGGHAWRHKQSVQASMSNGRR